MIVSYIRVSSQMQSETRQVEALEKYNAERTFIEKVSARTKERAQFQEMMNFVREGDTIVVKDFSRLSRSTADLLSIINELNERNITLISDKENLDTSTATGRLMIGTIALINEFMIDCQKEAQLEGIEIAKRNGKYTGKKYKKYDLKLFRELYDKYNNRIINKGRFAQLMDVSRPTLDKLIKVYEERRWTIEDEYITTFNENQ